MTSLTRSDSKPVRLRLDRCFRPCEALDGEEIYPNGIFEFNITRLLAYIDSAGRFRAELVALDDLPYAGTSPRLNELTVLNADLSRPVILAEIAPGQYNLIDGHHRVAKARREMLAEHPRVSNLLPRACDLSHLYPGLRDVCRILEF